MYTAALVFNPRAGIRWREHERQLQKFKEVLTAAGVRTLTTATRGPQQPLGTLFEGMDDFDTVIACGGDGTVNEVLQALVMSDRDAALGVLPFGSGNLLARELNVGRDVERWLEWHSRCEAQPRPVACIEQTPTGERRYWIAAAGVGADARVICNVNPSAKARFGMAAYYAESLRQLLFSDDRLPLFEVEFEDFATGMLRREIVAQVVAERIGYFGRFLENGAASPLPPDQFRVALFKTAEKRTFLEYGLALLGSQLLGCWPRTRNDIEVVRTREIRCYPAEAAAAHQVYGAGKNLAEVDGELVGELPVRLFLTEQRVKVLSPTTRSP